jgi:hypothetical protein
MYLPPPPSGTGGTCWLLGRRGSGATAPGGSALAGLAPGL